MFVAAPLTRRSALASAVLAPALLTACDIDPPTPKRSTGEPAPQPPEDSQLVVTVVAALVEAAGVVRAAAEAVPALSAELEPLAQAHDAHLEVLDGALPAAEAPSPPSATVPPRPGPALNAVRRGERRLLRTLRDSCVAADSGDLARLLASMAASVSQHAVALTRQATP